MNYSETQLFNEFPDIMNVTQLQSALGVGRSTAYLLVASGDIKSFRIGAAVRIPKTSVISYVNKMCYNEASSSDQVNPGCQKGAYL